MGKAASQPVKLLDTKVFGVPLAPLEARAIRRTVNGMGKSGGGGGTNANDVAIARMKADEEEKARIRAANEAQDAENKRGIAFGKSMTEGVEGLRARGREMVAGRGLDPAEYGGTIDSAINAVTRGIDPKDANPGQYYTDSVIEKALGDVRDQRRTAYKTNLSNVFQPGFEQKYFTDSADDNIIDQIMQQQRGDATRYAMRMRDRGQMDDAGYVAALARINDMEQTGRATAQKLGGAVLQGNRTRLTDIANEATAAASGYELGQKFDYNTWGDKFNTTRDALTGSLDGDLRSAIGGQKYFDLGDLVMRAGQAQGTSNPQMEGIDAMAARQKLRERQRGIGSGGGVF